MRYVTTPKRQTIPLSLYCLKDVRSLAKDPQETPHPDATQDRDC